MTRTHFYALAIVVLTCGAAARAADEVIVEPRLTLSPGTGVNHIAFSPDGQTLAAGITRAERGLVSLCDVATGREIGTRPTGGDWVEFVTYSPDGKHLA